MKSTARTSTAPPRTVRKRTKRVRFSPGVDYSGSLPPPHTIAAMVGGAVDPIQKPLRASQCHPSLSLSGNAVLDASCFTPTTIAQLKRAFNTHLTRSRAGAANANPTTPARSPITASDPVMVWNQLRERIPECERESCWVDALPDPALKDRLKSQLFVPERPEEWRANRNSWLSNFDIIKVMEQYQAAVPSFRFFGPGFIDFDYRDRRGACIIPELCDLRIRDLRAAGVKYLGVVFNLDTHAGKGTHWVAVFADISPTAPFFFFFNSTGEPIPNGIARFRNSLATSLRAAGGTGDMRVYASSAEHQKSNTECGMYALVFLVTMLTGEIPGTVALPGPGPGPGPSSSRPRPSGGPRQRRTMSMAQRIRFFTDAATKLTDKDVERFRYIYFR